MTPFPMLRYALILLISSILVVASVQAEPVKLAVLLPSSNIFKAYGASAKNGFLLGVKTEATEQKVDWESWMTFEFLDTRSDKAHSLQIAKTAIANGSKAILGMHSSGVTLHLRDYVLDEAKVPMVIFSAGTSGDIRRKHPLFLRVTNHTWQYGIPLGSWLKKHPITSASKPKPRWVCIHADYTFGRSFCDGFKAGYQDVGEEIGRVSVPLKKLDKKHEIIELTKLKPDFAVGVFAGAEAITFVRDFFRFKVNERFPLVMPGFTFTPKDLLKHAKTLEKYGTGVGVLNILPYTASLDNEANQHFVKLFKETYNTSPNVFSMRGYDAGRLLVKALAKLQGKWHSAQVIELMKTLPTISPRHGQVLTFDSHGDAINPGYIFITKRDGDKLVNEMIGRVPLVNVDDYQK